jgi:NADPH:quinone reductase-like Zn-dependent oxidoreductase
MMKAIRVHAPGGPEQLVVEKAPMPDLRDGDVLVRVLSCGLTRGELAWGPTSTDENGVSRLPSIPGHDLCGIVEKTAPGVKAMEEGTIVYGLSSFFRDGAAAEYIAVSVAELAPKPQSLHANVSAAVPTSGLTAWQALFEHGGLTKGNRVLIHGAAGSVGTFAVQLAHWCGAEVIGLASGDNLETVRALGADRVFDYGEAPFEGKVNNVDIVLDTIGGEIQQRSWSVLRPGGTLVSIVGEPIAVPDIQKDKRGVFFVVRSEAAQLVEPGKRGKIVLRIAEE